MIVDFIPKDRKMTPAEVDTALRQLVIAEHEAIQLYTLIYAAIPEDHPAAAQIRAVLKDVREEEVVHVGEFTKLLLLTTSGEAEAYRKGDKEVSELLSDSND